MNRSLAVPARLESGPAGRKGGPEGHKGGSPDKAPLGSPAPPLFRVQTMVSFLYRLKAALNEGIALTRCERDPLPHLDPWPPAFLLERIERERQLAFPFVHPDRPQGVDLISDAQVTPSVGSHAKGR